MFRPRLFWDGGNGRIVLRHRGRDDRGPRRRNDARHDAARCGRAVSRGARHPARRRRRRRARRCSTDGTCSRRAARSRSSGTTTSSAKCSSAIGTTPRSAKSRSAARPARHTWVARRWPSSTTPIARTIVPQFASHLHDPRACSCRTTSTIAPWLSLSASGRLDHHNEYGTFFSPRVVGARCDAGAWNSRLSVGTGFFGPSALTEETEAAGLSRLAIPRAAASRAGAQRVARRHAHRWTGVATR